MSLDELRAELKFYLGPDAVIDPGWGEQQLRDAIVVQKESAVVNRERWLDDARTAAEGVKANVEKLREDLAAAEADAPIFDAAVSDAEAALEEARGSLAETKAAAETTAHAGTAEAEGSVG